MEPNTNEATAPKRLKTGGKKPIIIIGVIVAVLLAAYVGLAHVCRFPERKDYPWREQAPDDAVVAQRCEALGRIVFADAHALVDLNAITHSAVGAEVKRRLREWAMQGGTLAAIDAVALFEGGADALCTATFAVTAPSGERIRRIMEREGISEEYAKLRIGAQAPDSYYSGRCTEVLVNDKSKEDFAKLCESEFRKVI